MSLEPNTSLKPKKRSSRRTVDPFGETSSSNINPRAHDHGAANRCSLSLSALWNKLHHAISRRNNTLSQLDQKYFSIYHQSDCLLFPDHRGFMLTCQSSKTPPGGRATASSDNRRVSDSCLMPIVISIFGIDGSGKSTVLFRLKGDSGNPPAGGSWGFTTARMIVKPRRGLGHQKRRARIPETQLMLYDVGGSSKIRNIWQNYLAESHACIYVVDSSDPSRFSETSDALRKIYLDPRMKGKPLVILANKQNNIPKTQQQATCSATNNIEEIFQQLNLCDLISNARHDSQEPNPPSLLNLVGDSRNQYGLLGQNILIQPCSAKLSSPQLKKRNLFSSQAGPGGSDPNIKTAFLWLLAKVHASLPEISSRIQIDSANQKLEWAQERAAQKKRVEMNKLQVQVAAASTTVEQKVAVGPMVSDTTARNACDEQQQQQQQTVQKHGTIGEATQDNNTTETCTETTTMTHHHEAKDAKKEEHIDDTLVFLDSIEAQELFELPKKADVQPLDIQPMHIIQPPREMKKSSFLKKEDEVLPLSDPVTVLPVLSAEVGGTIKQIHLLEPVAIVPSPAPHETQQQSSVDQPIGQPNTDSDAPLKKARRSSTTLASTTGSSITLTPTPPPPPPSHANEKSQTCTQSSPRQVKKSKSIELSAQATKPRPTSAKKSTPVSSSSRLTSATARKPKLRQQQPQHQQQQQKAEDSKQQLIKPQESIIKSKESLKESNMIGGFNDGANATPIIPISLAAAGASIMTKKSLLPPIGGNISAGSQHEEEDVVPGVLAGQISLAADGRVESTVSIKKGLVEQVDSAFCLDSAM